MTEKKTVMIVETKTYYLELEEEVKDNQTEEIDWEQKALDVLDDETIHINESTDINVILFDESEDMGG